METATLVHFSANIQFLRKRQKRSQEDIAGAIGLKRSTLSAYEIGAAEPNMQTLIRFSRYFKMPVDHLIATDLSKLSPPLLASLEKGEAPDISGKHLRVLATTVDQNNEENIEIVPIKAKAGYASGYADPEFIRVLPTFQLPFLSKNKKYRTFQISGDSMPPVSNGSWVTGEFLQNWRLVRNGYPHIVVTKEEGVVFKIVYNKIDENQTLLLCSTNPEYKPYEIGVEEVLEIWSFVNYISQDMPPGDWEKDKLSDTVAALQREVELIKNRLGT